VRVISESHKFVRECWVRHNQWQMSGSQTIGIERCGGLHLHAPVAAAEKVYWQHKVDKESGEFDRDRTKPIRKNILYASGKPRGSRSADVWNWSKGQTLRITLGSENKYPGKEEAYTTLHEAYTALRSQKNVIILKFEGTQQHILLYLKERPLRWD
jgi:hypothetical protein